MEICTCSEPVALSCKQLGELIANDVLARDVKNNDEYASSDAGAASSEHRRLLRTCSLYRQARIKIELDSQDS